MVGDKSQIRQRARVQRDAMPSNEREAASAAIARRLLEWLPDDTRRVALYYPIQSEVSTDALFTQLRRVGIEVYYPRVGQDDALEFCPVTALDQLVATPRGLREPTSAATPVETLDVVVVPGLAFDRDGARLGYGAGYYDRALASFTGLSIGVCFEAQVHDQLPHEAHDERVMLIATEARIIHAGAPEHQEVAWTP